MRVTIQCLCIKNKFIKKNCTVTGIKTIYPAKTTVGHSISGFLNETTKAIVQNNNSFFLQFHKDLKHWYTIYSEQNNITTFIHSCRNHDAIKLFHEEPITNRSYYKPRGYAGDAELIDFIYRLKSPSPKTTYYGRELFANIRESNICKSVRWRAKHLAEKIEAVYQDKQRPITAMAIASGHLRELHLLENPQNKIAKLYALNQDARSNAEAMASLAYGFLDIRTDSILSIIKKSYRPGLPPDLIYSAGLFDYLNDKLASRLLARSFEFLSPGGTLLVANFAPGLVEQAYMEAFMDWHLIYRDEKQMEGLLDEIPGHQIREVKLYRDPMENVVYLEVIKN